MIAMLAEELFLLALDNGKGRVPCTVSAALPFGLAGAILAELIEYDSLQIDQSDIVFVKDGSPIGDDILDAALVQLSQSGEGRGFRYWLSALLYRMDDLENRLLGRLVRKGILRKEAYHFLGMFSLSTYRVKNPALKAEVGLRLRIAGLGDYRPDGRGLALLGLAEACNLTGDIFSRDERRRARERLKDTTGDKALGKLFFEVMYTAASSAAAAVIASSPAAVGALVFNEANV
jgi:golgi phosphoprotein 3